MYSSWLTHTRGRRDDPRKYRTKRGGAPSLEELAMRACIFYIDEFDERLIERLEEFYVKMIADRLLKTNTLSVKVWSIFRARYPEAVNHNYKLLIPEEKGDYPREVQSISRLLTTPKFADLLTFLCIRHLSIDANVLFALAKISTLRVLILEHHGVSAIDPNLGEVEEHCAVDDYILRKWGDAVQEKGYFPHLRVLALRRFQITFKALKGLNNFPSLLLCNLKYNLIGREYQAAHRLLTERLQERRNFSMLARYPPATYREIEPLIRGPGTPLDSDTWRYCEDFGSRGREEFDAEITFLSKELDMHRKMNLLHEGAFSLFNGPEARDRDTDKPSLSFDYGGPPSGISNEASFWFRRIHGAPLEPGKSTETPEGKRQKRDSPGPPPKKKRKMRDTGMQDIGSVLGSFLS